MRQKIGILLEEISSYLSSITSQFQNPHLLAYRRQYEGLLRQIEWEDMPHCTGDIGVQTQPNREEAEGVLLQGG